MKFYKLDLVSQQLHENITKPLKCLDISTIFIDFIFIDFI